MTGDEFISRLLSAGSEHSTVYMWGTFGAPVTEALIAAKEKQYPDWYTSARKAALRRLIGRGFFAFDCVGLIKGLLWGWSGDAARSYGGAVYEAGGLPDIGADTMITRCDGVSDDFADIQPGEAVWLSGHIGVYIGGGRVVECTPGWDGGVQITACLNLGAIAGLNGRKWTKHGKLPWIVPQGADSARPAGGKQAGSARGDDVPDAYAITAVNKAVLKGVLRGDGASLRLRDSVTRQDLCVMLERCGLLE